MDAEARKHRLGLFWRMHENTAAYLMTEPQGDGAVPGTWIFARRFSGPMSETRLVALLHQLGPLSAKRYHSRRRRLPVGLCALPALPRHRLIKVGEGTTQSASVY